MGSSSTHRFIGVYACDAPLAPQRSLGMSNSTATITLIGSGEFGEAMSKVYRAILAKCPPEPGVVFLDTPAGFELNADAISAKAVEYFAQRLQLDLAIATFKHKARASAVETEAAVRALRRADMIFAGPGSPSYAIRNWRSTPVWETVLNRFERGAHLVLASAAAIATGSAALPVYEIYKVGEELHWLDGLNLFTALGMNLAIVPHWNNNEGGTYDTRFCFMGKSRFRELEQELARDTTVLGIDEYTACMFDCATETVSIFGAGNVTVRCDGQEWVYPSGQNFSFDQLRLRVPMLQGNAQAALLPIPNAGMNDETSHYLLQLARALNETETPDLKRHLIDRAHDTMHELSAAWIPSSHLASQENIAPYIETLIEIRRQLRAAKQYALADEIRKRLTQLDIVLEDNSAGTTWRNA